MEYFVCGLTCYGEHKKESSSTKWKFKYITETVIQAMCT